MLALLHKCQSKETDVRLCSVQIVNAMWREKGQELIFCLSDLMLFVVELLEDRSEHVEHATRQMLTTVEKVTGENVHELLKAGM
jgi:hypothetical protein